MTEISTTITSKLDEIQTSFTDLINKATGWGSDLMTNFISGLESQMENLISSVTKVANTIESYIGFSEPEEGPLSDFHTYAPDMMNLFAQGIRDNQRMLNDAVTDAFDFSSAIGTQRVEGAAGASMGLNGWSINVYGAQGMDEMTLARLVANEVRDQVVSIGALA